MQMYTDYAPEIYKVRHTCTKNLTEFFCIKQYQFLLLTKPSVLSYNINVGVYMEVSGSGMERGKVYKGRKVSAGLTTNFIQLVSLQPVD